MKREITQELNRYSSIDNNDYYKITRENLPIENSTITPEEGIVEIDAMTGIGGLRLRWKRIKDGKFDTVIEEMRRTFGGKLEWVPVGGVQKITIEVDVDNPVPIVTMKRIIF